MHSSTFGKGWVGMSACPLVVLACESLHLCTVCTWRCEHARFCVEVFYALCINFHSFIHTSDVSTENMGTSDVSTGNKGTSDVSTGNTGTSDVSIGNKDTSDVSTARSQL